MARRKLSPKQELQQYVNECAERYEHWTREREDGCVDPNWSDGDNLNLVRTHIICAKGKIRHTCEAFGLALPAIYYRALPPILSSDFFVLNGKNYNPCRIERIKDLRGSKKAKPAPIRCGQMSLF